MSFQYLNLVDNTVEPRLSDSRLSVPSIIRNDVQKFLKQVANS